MTFQVLDSKNECVGFYQDGHLLYDKDAVTFDTTWDYSSILQGLQIEYARIYAEGKSLDEVCPEHLKPEWERVNKKIKAFISSFINGKVSLKENCFFDLVPARYLKEFYDAKNKITEHVISNYHRPEEYEFFKNFTELIGDIRSRELQLDRSWLSEKLYDIQAKKLWEKINNGETKIDYNLFGSITGRLTVSDSSFPILNLNKKLRSVIRPTNDWFVELDLNAAELRVAQALLNKKQVVGDLHEWSTNNIFKGELTRSEAKEVATSWLYNSSSKLSIKYNEALNDFYNKEALKQLYWVDGVVHTPFHRYIAADSHHAISYLNQSTLIDLFHRQILKLNNLLKDKKTFIAFMVHDCLVLDLRDEEKNILPDLINVLSDTQWGKFPVNIKIGSDYGNMKKVNIKV